MTNLSFVNYDMLGRSIYIQLFSAFNFSSCRVLDAVCQIICYDEEKV